MPTFSQAAPKNNELIRVSQDAVVLYAPVGNALLTTFVTNTGDLATFTGFESLGHMTNDGIQWTSEDEQSEIESHGRSEPTRLRRISNTRSFQVTLQETTKHSLGLFFNVEPTSLTMAATTGQVLINMPTIPNDFYYQFLCISVDTVDGDEFYYGTYVPRGKVITVGDQAWGKEGSIDFNLTIQAFRNETAGYAALPFIAGPGADALRTAMDFS